jgi:hypothetical protein
LEAFGAAIVLTKFAELARDQSFTEPLLDHLGFVAGAVDRMVADAHILKAEQQNAAWRDGWNALSSTLPLPPLGPWARLIANQIKSSGLGVFRDRWQAAGWPLAPAPVGPVAAREHEAIEVREDRRQADFLAALFAAGRATGLFPEASAPPRYTPDGGYLAARNRWANEEGLEPDDASARRTMWSAAEAFDAGVHRALSTAA